MTGDPRPSPDDVYIDAPRLAGLLGRSDLLVFDGSVTRIVRTDGSTAYASGHDIYHAGHVPTAIYADLFRDFSDPDTILPFMRPPLAQLERVLASHGFAEDMTVVVYDTLNGAWAARLWWVLKAAGLQRVHLLKGQFAAWRAWGGAVEAGTAAPRATSNPVSLTPVAGWFCDLAAVQSLIEAGHAATLLCALRPADFHGGHIPGSRLLSYASILDAEGVALPHLAAKAAQDLDLPADAPIVLYCGGGVNAAGVGAALREAGYRGVLVYDGSLAEWRSDPDRPVASGKPT